MHFPSPRIRVLDDKTLEFFGGFFFFTRGKLDAKRWDECDLAGFFTDIILSKKNLSIHHSLLQEAAVG